MVANKTKFLKIFFVFAFLVFLDQASKYLIRSTGGFYICNPGVAFGLSFFWMFIFLGIFSLIFLALNFKSVISKLRSVAILKFPIKNLTKSHFFGFFLILSGAISNIADRAHFGCVIDFIDIQVWPVFNLADIYITIGSVIVFWGILRNKA
jgi:signal peptidase II